jgi:tRNA-dihydrouridine synthase B
VKIGNVEIKGPAALAPMAGVADTAFRTVCMQFGAAYCVGEMASAKGLCLSGRGTRELLRVTDAERPMAVQLFGAEPEYMARAARIAAQYGPDVIDINMGCPAPKVVSGGAGSALMRDPALAGRIVAAVVSAVDIPVTVKLRRGWDEKSLNAVEVALAAESAGAAAVTVHGRTRAQQYAPPVDLETIAAVKRAVKIPVIGNGDVRTPQDAAAMYERTGCDLVMIGRGALGAPWLFAAVRQYLENGTLPPEPDVRGRMDVMLRHVGLICALRGERAASLEARKHAAWYMAGLRGAALLRTKACAMRSYDDAKLLAEEAVSLNE